MIACTHAELDAGDRDSALAAITSARPDAIVHCAAWTNVDGCEADPDHAFRDNALANRNVMEAARRVGAYVVALSTDYVFDGEKDAAYHEWDTPNPLSVYGASKLAGEFEIDPDCAVVRTSWVCGQHGSNAVKTILRLAQQKGHDAVRHRPAGLAHDRVRPRGRAALVRGRPAAGHLARHQPGRAHLVRVRPCRAHRGGRRSRPGRADQDRRDGPAPRRDRGPPTPSSTTGPCASPAARCSPTTATASTAS